MSNDLLPSSLDSSIPVNGILKLTYTSLSV